MVWAVLVAALTAYLLGNLNGSVCISALFAHDDVRKHGSGNAGLTNFFRSYGSWSTLLVIVVDMLKTVAAGYTAGFALASFGYYREGLVLGTVMVSLGHDFPALLGFKGGKGLASFGGMVLAYNPIIFLIMFMSAIVFVLLANYICFVPMLASVVFPVIYGIREKDVVGALILGIVAVVIFIKHIENLKRISKGSEFRISFLWNKNKELERLHITPDEEESVEETEAADEEPEHVNN